MGYSVMMPVVVIRPILLSTSVNQSAPFRSEPERAIRPSRDPTRIARRSWNGILSDDASRGNPPDFAVDFCEPKRAIRSARDLPGNARHGILGDNSCGRDPPNLPSRRFRKPERAIRPRHDLVGGAR